MAGTQSSFAQQPEGPFVPHRGMQIPTHFTNDFGRDAHSLIDIVDVSHKRMGSRMPVREAFSLRATFIWPGSISLSIPAAVQERLRSSGSAPLTLIYSDRLDHIDCVLVADLRTVPGSQRRQKLSNLGTVWFELIEQFGALECGRV